MGLYINYPSGWWVLLGVIYGLFLGVKLLRKKPEKNETRPQFIFAFITLALAAVVEFTGVSLGLWDYLPGNWPLPLPFTYFGVGLAGFQILRALDELK